MTFVFDAFFVSDSVSTAPSRNASPSPEQLPSSPPPANETIEGARNETEPSDRPTLAVPISNSTENAKTAAEGKQLVNWTAIMAFVVE